MAKIAKTGEEYKVLKQKSTPKRIAKIFTLIWVVFVMLPVLYISLTYAVQIKEYAFVKEFTKQTTYCLLNIKTYPNRLFQKSIFQNMYQRLIFLKLS